MAQFTSIKFYSLVLSLSLSTAASAADLRVEVRGMTSTDGKCMIALFDKAQDFPRKPAQAKMEVAAASGVAVVFTDLADGEYAVSTYHDENGNGKLDANLVGLPTERYGFSRDAAGMMGPPRFDDAKVSVNGAGQTLVINLR